MTKKRVKTTKLDIIKCASEFFFREGYSSTSPKMISEALDIYIGNITYYFPTKEHLLAVFVDMLCDFQWKMMEREADEGISSVMALCLEFAAMAAICEEDDVAKDFYLATYSSDICLEIIQRNDKKRAKQVFGSYQPNWTDEQFAEAVAIVSGIEYSTLRTNSMSPSLELRVNGAVETILTTFGVPEEIRKAKLEKLKEMDYCGISKRILKEFKKFVAETNDKAFEELINSTNNN